MIIETRKGRYKEMIKTEINVKSEEERKNVERKLKETGYQKTSDAFWAKIYVKGSNEITVTRDF